MRKQRNTKPARLDIYKEYLKADKDLDRAFTRLKKSSKRFFNSSIICCRSMNLNIMGKIILHATSDVISDWNTFCGSVNFLKKQLKRASLLSDSGRKPIDE